MIEIYFIKNTAKGEIKLLNNINNIISIMRKSYCLMIFEKLCNKLIYYI